MSFSFSWHKRRPQGPLKCFLKKKCRFNANLWPKVIRSGLSSRKRKKKREKRFNYSNNETFSSPSQTLKLFCQTKKYERFSETINFRWNVASKKVGEIIFSFFFGGKKTTKDDDVKKKLLVTSNAEKFLFWLFKKFWFCYYRTVKTPQKYQKT